MNGFKSLSRFTRQTVTKTTLGYSINSEWFFGTPATSLSQWADFGSFEKFSTINVINITLAHFGGILTEEVFPTEAINNVILPDSIVSQEGFERKILPKFPFPTERFNRTNITSIDQGKSILSQVFFIARDLKLEVNGSIITKEAFGRDTIYGESTKKWGVIILT